MILVPQPTRAWYLTSEGWKRVFLFHETLEFSADCWRAHLQAVCEAAEGRTVAALERQERES